MNLISLANHLNDKYFKKVAKDFTEDSSLKITVDLIIKMRNKAREDIEDLENKQYAFKTKYLTEFVDGQYRRYTLDVDLTLADIKKINKLNLNQEDIDQVKSDYKAYKEMIDVEKYYSYSLEVIEYLYYYIKNANIQFFCYVKDSIHHFEIVFNNYQVTRKLSFDGTKDDEDLFFRRITDEIVYVVAKKESVIGLFKGTMFTNNWSKRDLIEDIVRYLMFKEESDLYRRAYQAYFRAENV